MESTTYTINGKEFELRHHGVKGMKWGVRRARKEYAKLDKAKGEYKHAKKAYDRSFSYAANTPGGLSLSRVKRAQSDARWADARRDAKRLEKAKADFKAQKKAVRQNAPVAAKLERGGKAVAKGLAVVGGVALADQIYFGGAGSKAAKAAVTKAYTTLRDKMFNYTLLDAAGNVLKRYN